MADQSVPRVLVTYAKDNDQHTDLVRAFATLLRVEGGLDAQLDQWDDAVRRDWTEWFNTEVETADHVVVIGSPRYRRLSERAVGVEGLQITELKERLLDDPERWQLKIHPVVLPGGSDEDVPGFLRPKSARCDLISELTIAGVEPLLRVLTASPKHLRPERGTYVALRAPRILAEDRESLRPNTFFSAFPRRKLLDTALALRTDEAGKRRAVVFTGEGGIGKSVLLGQLLDRLEADPASPSAVLVSAASASGVRGTADEVDRQLGLAAHDDWGRGGLLALLHQLRHEHGSVTLLVDTLDLLLDMESRALLAAVLAKALTIGDVVLTCRTTEFTRYLSNVSADAPRLARNLADITLPVLSVPEMMGWAERHVAGLDVTYAQQDAFLRSLKGGLRSRQSLRQVCALPVRLALTCETFHRQGHVPEDLTVTGLYDEYWNLRVQWHPGRLGEAKARAALEIASHVVDLSSGLIALRVPQGELSAVDGDGLAMLESEGVLHRRRDSWEFFHQTFAEYGYARWLLSRGPRSTQVRDLADTIASGRATLWPVATSLLLQAHDEVEYRQLAELLPTDTLDGVKARTLGALQQVQGQPLDELVQSLRDRPQDLRVATPILGDAPSRHVTRAVAAVAKSVRRHPDDLLDLAIDSFVSLLGRTESATSLATALDALIEVRKSSAERTKAGEAAWDSYVERVLSSSLPRSARVRAVAVQRYRKLGLLGRRAVLRMHLDANQELSDQELVRLAEHAFVGECPPLTDGEVAELFELLWRSSAARAVLGWNTWIDMIEARLSTRWNNGQIKLAVRLALSDPLVAAEVVDGLLAGRDQAQEDHVAVFHQLAEQRPRATVTRVLTHPVPMHRMALSAIAKPIRAFTDVLTRSERRYMATWLRPAKEAASREVWPMVVVLAADDIPVHLALLAEFSQAELPAAVRQNVADTWYRNTPRPTLDVLLPALRALTRKASGDLLDVRARLEGRLADTDEVARCWVWRALFLRPSQKVAGTTATVVAESTVTMRVSLAEWLVTLLPTRHTDALKRLAMLLSAPEHADALRAVAQQLLPVVCTRLETAAAAGEDSDCMRELLKLAIRVDDEHPLTPAEVRRLHRIVCARLPLHQPAGQRENDHSAAFRDLILLTRVLTNRLPRAEVRERTELVLRGVDPRDLGRKIGRQAVTGLLQCLPVHERGTVEWMEDLFGEPELAMAVKMAIAEVFLHLDRQSAAGVRAARLKDRPDCPPEVVELLLRKLKD